MIHDVKRWDSFHQQSVKESELAASKYAQEKELQFPQGCVVVDLGGGTGEDALHFLKKGHRVIVFDISEFALKHAQDVASKHKMENRLAVKQVDFGLHKLPLKTNSVDIIYSRNSLNYFGRRQTALIFKDIHGVLKNGGVAYIALRAPDDVKEMKYLKENATEYEHEVYIDGKNLLSRFSVKTLKEILKSAEITNFEVNPYKEEGSQTMYLNEVVIRK